MFDIGFLISLRIYMKHGVDVCRPFKTHKCIFEYTTTRMHLLVNEESSVSLLSKINIRKSNLKLEAHHNFLEYNKILRQK